MYTVVSQVRFSLEYSLKKEQILGNYHNVPWCGSRCISGLKDCTVSPVKEIRELIKDEQWSFVWNLQWSESYERLGEVLDWRVEGGQK